MRGRAGEAHAAGHGATGPKLQRRPVATSGVFPPRGPAGGTMLSARGGAAFAAPPPPTTTAAATTTSASSPPRPSLRERVGRVAIWCRRLCVAVVVLATAASVGAVALYAAFVNFEEAVGLPLTRVIVRLHMPRPEHFRSGDGTTAHSDTDGSQQQLQQRQQQRSRSSAGFPSDAALLTAAQGNLAARRLAGWRWGARYEATRPNAVKYGPHQWLWDSCFHAMILARRNASAAVAELRSLYAMQDAPPSSSSWLCLLSTSAPTPSDLAYPLARASSVLHRPSTDSMPADAAPSAP